VRWIQSDICTDSTIVSVTATWCYEVRVWTGYFGSENWLFCGQTDCG
jgi:hypothetical protein